MYYYIYYYDVDGNKILKYEVGFDLQKVRELQVNLVRDCGDERHYVYITHEIPLKSKDLIYMKFECKKLMEIITEWKLLLIQSRICMMLLIG